MGHGSIAGNPARQPYSLFPGKSFKAFFYTLVNIAQSLFQVEHFLAHRLETEMSRLDDSGMNRPHRYLIDALAFRPYPAILSGNTWHPGLRGKGFAQRPGLRPVLKLDPGPEIRTVERGNPIRLCI